MTAREYWIQQMEAAYELMLAIQAYPVEECGEGFVHLPEAVREAGVEVRFSTEPHAAGAKRMFYLRRGLVAGFLAAARALNERGWVLKVEDAYRTRYMQKHLAIRQDIFTRIVAKVRWELEGRKPPLDLLRRRVAALVAMSPKVGTHTSGSAMDVSVYRREDGREDGQEIDRGAPYVELSEKTPMGSPFVPEAAQANRREITALMARHGFVTYPFEFWHYNAGDALAACLARGEGTGGQRAGTRPPARYGPIDFDPATGAVTPIADPTQPLNSEEELAARLEETLRETAG